MLHIRSKRGRRALRWPLAIAAGIAALLIFSFCASAQEAPRLSINYYNLSYSESTYVLYAVSFEGIDPDATPIELLFWDGPQDDYVKGTEAYAATAVGMASIGGKPHAVFYSEGIAAKNLTLNLYSCAYADTAAGAVYSEPVKYSALKYLIDLPNRSNATQADRDLAAALRNYGAAAQIKFNSTLPDCLASDTFRVLTLENAHFEDGFSYGWVKDGTEVTLTADTQPGRRYSVTWYDGSTVVGTGATLTLTADADRTLRADVIDMGAVEEYEGAVFTASQVWNAPTFYTASPMTVEASFRLPASYEGRGGVLLGNYGSGEEVISVELYTGGRLRLYFDREASSASQVIFDTDLRGGTRKIAVTIPDKNGVCRLYVDGVLTEEKTMPCAIPRVRDLMVVGGDHREGNAQYFKGEICSLAVFDGVRSADKIAADALYGADPADPDLLCAYCFTAADARRDLGPYGRDLTLTRTGFCPTSVSDRYSLTEPFATVPRTYEAVFECDADVETPQKGCTIIGNYNDVYVPGITFRVYLDGRPGLCLRYSEEDQYQYYIGTSILGMGRVHVAITLDDTYVYGYLNGELVLKKKHRGFLPDLTPYPFSVGGDNRIDNTWWFRDGAIYSVNLFSEYRTAEQIRRDAAGVDVTDPTLMLSFDFEHSQEDRSPAGNTLLPYFYDGSFVDPDTYDYTIACVGDTQKLVKMYPDEVHNIYDFLLDNVDAFKIERVIGLGDMTDDNTDEQWELVRDQIFRLDGVVPYNVVRGNHDHYARTPEAEATKEEMFGYYFDNETYAKQYDGSYDGTPAHTYKRFTAGGVNYLLLCLDYGPDDDVLAWASSVIEQYPDDRCIVVTHAFLFHDGTTIDENNICPPRTDGGSNNCDEMWDKFVSKHESIVLVLCGHDPSNDIVVSRMTGDNGNTVTCVLINAQDTDRYDRPAGIVTLLHFSDGGHTVTVENYSTVEGKFYKTCNQLVIENVGLAA